MNTEEKIWSFLKARGLTDAGAAGLMGNLYAESGLRPNNLQNSYEGKLGMTDAEYTERVDSGSYTNFVRDSAGYGLCQWTYWNRKKALLAYAKKAGKSIGDLEMQLGFLMQELASGYKAVLATLKAAASVQAASDAVLLQFERPADQSEAVKATERKCQHHGIFEQPPGDRDNDLSQQDTQPEPLHRYHHHPLLCRPGDRQAGVRGVPAEQQAGVLQLCCGL